MEVRLLLTRSYIPSGDGRDMTRVRLRMARPAWPDDTKVEWQTSRVGKYLDNGYRSVKTLI